MDELDFQNSEVAKKLLVDTVSSDVNVANAAKARLGYEIAVALSLPLKQGVIYGDTHSGIFTQQRFEPGVPVEYPLDFLTPGSEGRHVAYVVPHTGRVPDRQIESDFVMVKTFDIASSIDWPRKYPQYARWDVVGRAMKVLDGGFVRKRNNDAWHTLISAASDRGVSVTDSAAGAGLFTKRLIELAQVIMRRKAGGNSTSINRGKLTHIALSPEGLGDIRSWDATQVDELTRREIYLAPEGSDSLTKVFGVILIDLDELGVGQEYQLYYNNTLGATTPGSKNEICVGLDLANGADDSFHMPWIAQPNGEMIETLNDVTLLRQNREGYWARHTYGVAVMDNRRVLILAF